MAGLTSSVVMNLMSTIVCTSLVKRFSSAHLTCSAHIHWPLSKGGPAMPWPRLSMATRAPCTHGDWLEACYSLVMGSGSFRTDWLEAGIGGGLSTTLRPGLKCGSLESKFGRGPGTRDKSGMGWSCSCLGCERGVCFSRYPAGHINSRITVSTWRYSLTTI
jgi:hypothetical protein